MAVHLILFFKHVVRKGKSMISISAGISHLFWTNWKTMDILKCLGEISRTICGRSWLVWWWFIVDSKILELRVCFPSCLGEIISWLKENGCSINQAFHLILIFKSAGIWWRAKIDGQQASLIWNDCAAKYFTVWLTLISKII